MKIKVLFPILLSVILSIHELPGQDPGLLPVPASASWGKGFFSLEGAVLVVPPDLLTREKTGIGDFIARVKNLTGLDLETTALDQPGKHAVSISSAGPGSAVPVPGEKTGSGSRESYQITVTAGRIDVKAATDAGVFYALKTLGQMIVNGKDGAGIPEATIDDYPSMVYRGVMMDLSHGGLLTEEEIKRQIDFLASFKMNQYYFYNEVSIEMKGYPLINYNACYRQDQVRRIIEYARERHMDVIPFVEFYGHLHELLRIEKYAGLGIGNYGHDLDPREKEAGTILANWIGQYANLFPTPFIHIGFDETWETERLKKSDPSIKPKELYMSQLNFVNDAVRSYGKKVLVWTDISNNYPDIISEFPRDVIPVLWEYSDEPGSVDKWLAPVKKEKLPFFVQSAVDSWGNVYPAAKYTFDNIDVCLRCCHDENAIGYITSVWTDAVQPLLRNTWLFMAYGCTGAWQAAPVDRAAFTGNFCRIMYPGKAVLMTEAFNKMSESEDHLAACLGRHTLSEMWEDPFSSYHLKNTSLHLEDFKKARLAAEEAMEKLITALDQGGEDTEFIKSMLVNSRQLDFTATRFIWAKTITDRWNWIYDLKSKGEKDYVMYYDINYTTHGLLVDMMDYCTALKEEYKKAWLSENMDYRLGTIAGRFDSEYLLWRGLAQKIGEYINHGEQKVPRQKFEKLFLNNR